MLCEFFYYSLSEWLKLKIKLHKKLKKCKKILILKNIYVIIYYTVYDFIERGKNEKFIL